MNIYPTLVYDKLSSKLYLIKLIKLIFAFTKCMIEIGLRLIVIIEISKTNQKLTILFFFTQRLSLISQSLHCIIPELNHMTIYKQKQLTITNFQKAYIIKLRILLFHPYEKKNNSGIC